MRKSLTAFGLLIALHVKYQLCNQRNAAFAFIEFLVLVVSVAVLLLLFASATPRNKSQSPRVKCTVNLKQVALGYAIWAQDNQQVLPMESPTSAGGVREQALAGDLLSSVRIVADQLGTPSVLICPGDKKRKPAETFGNLTTAGISYFLNVDAAIANQNQILAGDRSLAIAGSRVKSGLLQITNAWGVQWTNWLHGEGNVALIDGSVHQVTTKGLRDLLALGGPTSRLIIP